MENHKPRWTHEELKVFEDLLIDGVSLEAIFLSLPLRNEESISRKALYYGYRTKTEDGYKRLYYGVSRRNRVSKAKVSQQVSAPDLVEKKSVLTVSEGLVDIRDTSIAKETLTTPSVGAFINTKVVSMLQEYDVKITPDIIYHVSQHIMKTEYAG